MKTMLTTIMLGVLAFAQPAKKAAIQRFGEGDLQLIKTEVSFSTLIIFPEGEELAEVTCGDATFWVIEGKGRFVHVKPTKPGLVTNLNVILKSDRVYSFLLKEISKPGVSKSKDPADVKVVIPADQDEVSQLRKQNENLQELVTKDEREIKSLHDERDAVKKEAQKKTADEAPPTKPAEDVVTPRIESPAAEEKLAAAPPSAAAAKPAVVENTPTSTAAPSSAPSETPTFSTIHVERREGILVTSGRFLWRFFRKVGRTLRLY